MRVLALTCLLFAACHGSGGGSQDQLLAKATIGAAGGELEVTDGEFAGLRLTVPGGALAGPVEVRMLKPVIVVPPGAAAPVWAGIGPLVRIEPIDLVFATPATLRLPYFPQSTVTITGPGNVQAMRQVGTNSTRVDPLVVDIDLGRIEFLTSVLGGFQVVPAPSTDFIDYLPAAGSVAHLEDGYSVAATEVIDPHQPGRQIVRWLVDTGSDTYGLDLVGAQIAGTISPSADWQEVWDTPLDFMIPEVNATTPPATTVTAIYNPISAAVSVPGSASLLARWAFEVPLHIGGREFRNVLRIRMAFAWQRQGVPTGSTEHVYWFAPGVGLLQQEIDGFIRVRTDL